MTRGSTALILTAVVVVGCVSPIDVDIAVVNPCNQQALQEVDFLRFEPRGKNVDSNGLTVVQRVADNVTPAIPIPLTIPTETRINTTVSILTVPFIEKVNATATISIAVNIINTQKLNA